MTTARKIADYLIWKFAKDGTPISHLKLQKMLYYAQAWYLALHGKRLFSERIEAWVHGPVVPAIFRTFRGHGWLPLANVSEPTLSEDMQTHLDSVCAAYGHLTAVQLEALSHRERPWKRAREVEGLGPSERSTALITEDSMREFYGNIARAR